MKDTDIAEFGKLLDTAADTCGTGTAPSVAVKRAYFDLLHPIAGLDAVAAALRAHALDPVRGKFMPKPADIMAQLHALAAQDGRPDPDEAWAIAARAADETATVVWTDEIREAWAVARDVLELGDEVGARMAFKGAYGRLLAAARATPGRPVWHVSEGHSAPARLAAVEAAVKVGRLPQSELLRIQAVTPAQGDLLALEGARARAPQVALDTLDRLHRLVDEWRDRPGRDALQREETRKMQAAAAQRVDEILDGDAP